MADRSNICPAGTLGNILILGCEVLACNATSGRGACFVVADSLEVLALALLGNSKGGAIVLELYDPAIEFKAMVGSKLLTVLGQEFGVV